MRVGLLALVERPVDGQLAHLFAVGLLGDEARQRRSTLGLGQLAQALMDRVRADGEKPGLVSEGALEGVLECGGQA